MTEKGTCPLFLFIALFLVFEVLSGTQYELQKSVFNEWMTECMPLSVPSWDVILLEFLFSQWSLTPALRTQGPWFLWFSHCHHGLDSAILIGLYFPPFLCPLAEESLPKPLKNCRGMIWILADPGSNTASFTYEFCDLGLDHFA
jgi:hypothetical protein